MDQVTQQNATLVEEAKVASRSMQEQAQSLQQLVAVFQIAAMEARPTARPAALPVNPARLPAPRHQSVRCAD